MLTYGIPPDFHGGVHLFNPPYAIGSVPSLSGHAIAYRWRSLPRVRRHNVLTDVGVDPYFLVALELRCRPNEYQVCITRSCYTYLVDYIRHDAHLCRWIDPDCSIDSITVSSTWELTPVGTRYS